MESQSNPIRIAVDAMGGDNAPAEIVRGAVQYAERGEAQVILVGDTEALEGELASHYGAERPRVAVVPSEGVVYEGESPAMVLRQKPRASIIVATGLVKRGGADACVSMGSTGAAMAAAAIILGLAKGVERPALGGPVIGGAPRTCLLDLGANVDSSPRQLLSFAAIGEVFARSFWGVENPRIALLSVGAEAGKGNRQTRETAELLAASGMNFIGNVEASDLPSGAAEVVVCDGFVGNIAMKLTEGLGRRFAEHLRERLADKLPADALEGLLADFHAMNNVVETRGGGPLFGVNGLSVVGHGAARADAVERAIETAAFAAETDFIPNMNQQLEALDARLRSRDGGENA